MTELQTLTKTVSELQKTVFYLTGTVQKLQQKDRVTATVSSADTEHNTEAIQERDSNLFISGPADQNDLLGAGVLLSLVIRRRPYRSLRLSTRL